MLAGRERNSGERFIAKPFDEKHLTADLVFALQGEMMRPQANRHRDRREVAQTNLSENGNNNLAFRAAGLDITHRVVERLEGKHADDHRADGAGFVLAKNEGTRP